MRLDETSSQSWTELTAFYFGVPHPVAPNPTIGANDGSSNNLDRIKCACIANGHVNLELTNHENLPVTQEQRNGWRQYIQYDNREYSDVPTPRKIEVKKGNMESLWWRLK